MDGNDDIWAEPIVQNCCLEVEKELPEVIKAIPSWENRYSTFLEDLCSDDEDDKKKIDFYLQETDEEGIFEELMGTQSFYIMKNNRKKNSFIICGHFTVKTLLSYFTVKT